MNNNVFMMYRGRRMHGLLPFFVVVEQTIDIGILKT